jgi:hypothetical protein
VIKLDLVWIYCSFLKNWVLKITFKSWLYKKIRCVVWRTVSKNRKISLFPL